MPVTYISSATTTQVLTGSGRLRKIVAAGGTLGAVTVYDNTASSGNEILSAVIPTAGQVFSLDIPVVSGIRVVTAAATKLAVYHDKGNKG